MVYCLVIIGHSLALVEPSEAKEVEKAEGRPKTTGRCKSYSLRHKIKGTTFICGLVHTRKLSVCPSLHPHSIPEEYGWPEYVGR